jgi:hypothetical protein
MSNTTFAALTAADACSDPIVAAARARAVDEAARAGDDADLPGPGDPIFVLIDWARYRFFQAIHLTPPLLPLAAALHVLMALLGVDPQSAWHGVPGGLKTAVLAELRAGIVRRAQALAAERGAGEEDGARRGLADALLSLVGPAEPSELTGVYAAWLELEGVPGMVAGVGLTKDEARADAACWAHQLAQTLVVKLRDRAVWPEGRESEGAGIAPAGGKGGGPA